MHTVAETEVFSADAKSIWSEDERLEFIGWIAQSAVWRRDPGLWWLPQGALVAFWHG